MMRSFKMFSRIRKALRQFAKGHTGVRKLMRRIMYMVRRCRYIVISAGCRTDKRLIVFESFSGRGYSDSPKAIYEYMLHNDEYNDFRFVWIFREPEKYGFITDNPRTVTAVYMSTSYERYLAKAGYWIFNYRALDHLVPKKNQVYVQCWHGTPLKRLGYDIMKSDNAMNSLEEIKDKYRRDAARFSYLLSPCAFATEKFTTAWNLKEWGKADAVIETGYPRNDFLVNHTSADADLIRKKLGLENEERKVILYAPTWRDNQHDSGVGYTYRTEVDFDYLMDELAEDYIILFRAHYLVASSFDFSRYEGFVFDVSGVDDINELYVISDMLVTDYSSVFFDYAILRRPIYFFMYDLEEYRDELRGFYLELDELPGPIATKEVHLLEKIRLLEKNSGKNVEKNKNLEQGEINNQFCKYYRFNEKFNCFNDGKATYRVLNKILHLQ